MKKKIEAEFTIVTPMFIGDANQEAHDVRPPSLKGALRFWWRALNWGRMLVAEKGDTEQALRALHGREARLFGLATSDKAGGQGVFLLSLKQDVKVQNQGLKMNGAQLYLLGQGLAKGSTTRSALTGTFTASLLFRPGTKAEDQHSVAEALFAFGLLGGLGSRARHGMGSVSLTGWQGDGFSVPQTRADYTKAVKGLLAELPEALPPFTAFSRQCRIDISAEGKQPNALLTTVGGELQMYRSFGQNGKVAGKPAERNFVHDHDLVQAVTKGTRISKAPRRSVFGLPHNYYFSSTGKVDINYAPGGDDARRASPLLLHIHCLPDGTCLAVHTLLPATFLPNEKEKIIRVIKVEKKEEAIRPEAESKVPFTPDWQVIHTFLDRFKTRIKLIEETR